MAEPSLAQPWPRRVLAGYDGSTASQTACAFALWLAGKADAATLLVHVCEDLAHTQHHASHHASPAVLREAAERRSAEDRAWRRRLDDLAEYAASDATIESVVARGNAAAVLVEEATFRGMDLLLVGSTGVGAAKGTFLGSVSSQVVRHAPCPVMLFRAGEAASPAKVRSVVVGLDGSPASLATLAFAEHLARPFDAQLVLVAAYPSSVGMAPPTPELRGELRRHAADVVAQARAGLTTEADAIDELVEESSREALIAAVQRHGPAVVAVGNRGLGGFRGLLLGATARWIANHAPCPVLVGRAGP